MTGPTSDALPLPRQKTLPERKMMVNNNNSTTIKQHPRGAAAIASRMAKLNDPAGHCTVFQCTRPSMVAAKVGLAAGLCKFHTQYRQWHGCAWAPSLGAKDLRPYTVKQRSGSSSRRDSLVAYPFLGLRGLLDGAGAVVPPIGLRHRTATQKARVALARLRDAGVTPEKNTRHLYRRVCLAH